MTTILKKNTILKNSSWNDTEKYLVFLKKNKTYASTVFVTHYLPSVTRPRKVPSRGIIRGYGHKFHIYSWLLDRGDSGNPEVSTGKYCLSERTRWNLPYPQKRNHGTTVSEANSGVVETVSTMTKQRWTSWKTSTRTELFVLLEQSQFHGALHLVANTSRAMWIPATLTFGMSGGQRRKVGSSQFPNRLEVAESRSTTALTAVLSLVQRGERKSLRGKNQGASVANVKNIFSSVHLVRS